MAITAVWALHVGESKAQADQIAEYIAGNDPTSEGFLVAAASNVATQFVDDNGVDAWQMDHAGDSTQFASSFYYAGLTSEELQKTNLGWTLEARARLVVSSPYENSINIGFDNGTTRYDMVLSDDGNGDTLIQLVSTLTSPRISAGPEVVVAGTGYRDYELVFDANNQSADLFVDGVELISDYTGHNTSINNHGLRFGVANGTTGNFNSVSLSAVPEPGSAAFLAAAAMLTVIRRRR